MARGNLLGLNRTVFALVLAAFALRLAAIPLVHRAGYTSDEREYVTIAQRIISGEGFVDSNGYLAVRAPLYPALLALVLFLGSLPIAHILGCLLGSIAVYQTYSLAKAVWKDHASAVGAAVAVSVHPGLVIYSTLLQTETLYIAFLLVALNATYKMVDEVKRTPAFLLGVTSGFAALSRAVYLGFFPILLGAFVWMKRGRTAADMKNVALAGALCVVVLLPWAYRNHKDLGSWIPISSGGGGSLLTGNNPYATGTWRTEKGFEEWIDASARRMGVENFSDLGEAERNRLSGIIAWEYMRDHPAQTLALALKKSHIFWIYPITHTDSYLPVQAVAVAADALLLLVASLGIVAGWKFRRQLIPLFAAVLFFWIVQAILHSEARFRLPLVPILAVAFGYGAATLLNRDRLRAAFALPGPRFAFLASASGIVAVYAWTGWMFLHGVIQ